MKYRKLTSDDLPEFRALWTEGLTRMPTAFLLSVQEVEALPESEIARRLDTALFLGAFDEADRMVGFVAARRGGTERLRHMADIGPLYVCADAEGRGVGRALMDLVLQHLREQAIVQAELVVDAENTRAQALYNALGFHRFGLRPRSVVLDGVGRDDLLMIRALDEADLTRDA